MFTLRGVVRFTSLQTRIRKRAALFTSQGQRQSKWYNPRMDSIVALDIETTGLDPETDAIIEIGAVRFTDRRIEGEWSTLIHPGRRIPPFITQLTGITDHMVLQAPSIKDVLPDLVNFVGDAPVLGHNVRFDLAFLRKQRILIGNEGLDTYELAAVLLPNAGRYNLGALAQALGVLLPATHRALDDARATRGIFLRLYEIALEMPLNLLAEIVRLSEPIEWGGYWPLHQTLRERNREIVSATSVRHSYAGPLFSERLGRPPLPLQPVEEPTPLNTDEVAALLELGGAFSRHFPQFEYRPQQVDMLRAVTEALSFGRHLLVEAGTGTGKSMSYLIPAALWAIQNGRRVVISTNTINLQDQLINKDIPDLRAALGLNLRATVLKGRSNYLCPRRLESFRRRGPSNADEMRVLAKLLVWLQGTESGDRAEINLNGPAEREVWMRLSAEDEACTSENCLKRTGGACPFYQVKQAAQSAHILIVNHALLLADVATGNRVLPEYEYLIVDEAHHIEDATTNALSFRVTQGDVDRLLRELGGPSAGLLGWLLAATQDVLAPSDFASLNQLVQQATDLAFRLDNLSRQFFITVDHFLNEQREGRAVGMYSHQERILPATRIQPAWGDVELSWDEAQHTLQPLLETLGKLAQGLAEINEVLAEEDEELYGSLTNLYRRLYEVHENLNALVFEPEPDRIYWAEAQSNSYRLSLHAAPLHIGPLMEHYIWREKAAVILTSATLTTGGEFDYLRGRLNAVDAYELALGSPFDYETATLLYILNDIPEPGDRHGHQRAIERGLINLCKTIGGRTLALFTSYDQLKRTSQAIAPVLAKSDIQVYEQGEGASAHTLLETFRTSERAVLLGTRAFWEGVDVPGEALSVLVIIKLPFDVPSDPIIAARSETFDDPFYQYSLPEAILRFRQGFGRLIRTQFDRGVIAIFDRRIITKRYGRAFIDSLPTCTVRLGPLANLPNAAARWLNL
jgi:ATP-dependent DNA helicase DinG